MNRIFVLLAVVAAVFVAGCHYYEPVYVYEPVPPPPPGYYVVGPAPPPPPPPVYYHPHGHTSFFLHIDD